MARNNDQPSKAEVQSTKLNQMPVPEADDTEFSAEEAAEAFEGQQNRSSQQNRNQQQNQNQS